MSVLQGHAYMGTAQTKKTSTAAHVNQVIKEKTVMKVRFTKT